jgi:hypothetical protein
MGTAGQMPSIPWLCNTAKCPGALWDFVIIAGSARLLPTRFALMNNAGDG